MGETSAVFCNSDYSVCMVPGLHHEQKFYIKTRRHFYHNKLGTEELI